MTTCGKTKAAGENADVRGRQHVRAVRRMQPALSSDRTTGDSIMRSSLILAGSTAWVLLWASPGSALSPETTCENAKLGAAARYHQCLVRAHTGANAQGSEPSEHALARCDERFDRAFERAEASAACRTPGGASTLREPLKAQVQTLVDNLTAETSCGTLTINPGETATCTVNKNSSAIDLATVVDQLSAFGVTDDTTFWIPAWGGDGSNGNVCCDFGGKGGQKIRRRVRRRRRAKALSIAWPASCRRIFRHHSGVPPSTSSI
jgi:hypothetical protein